MRTFIANQFPHFLSFSLTNEIYRPVLLANCMSECERNYVLLDEIFVKRWKIIKPMVN